jgi:hypothetical protein
MELKNRDKKIKLKITDYLKIDFNQEEGELRKLGINFFYKNKMQRSKKFLTAVNY